MQKAQHVINTVANLVVINLNTLWKSLDDWFQTTLYIKTVSSLILYLDGVDRISYSPTDERRRRECGLTEIDWSITATI